MVVAALKNYWNHPSGLYMRILNPPPPPHTRIYVYCTHTHTFNTHTQHICMYSVDQHSSKFFFKTDSTHTFACIVLIPGRTRITSILVQAMSKET